MQYKPKHIDDFIDQAGEIIKSIDITSKANYIIISPSTIASRLLDIYNQGFDDAILTKQIK